MTRPEEVADRRRERAAYLTAFYNLTTESDIRWATSEEIAARAGIPQDRILRIGQHLANDGFVRFRTLGGIHGSVELTNRGVYEAERLIQSGEADMVLQPSDYGVEADREWANTFRPLATFAYNSFDINDKWPDVVATQRVLDSQSDLSIDVIAALADLADPARSAGQLHQR